MKKKTKQPMAADWKNQTLSVRLDMCRRMLKIHGLLTDTEAHRVEHRTRKRTLRMSRGDGDA